MIKLFIKSKLIYKQYLLFITLLLVSCKNGPFVDYKEPFVYKEDKAGGGQTLNLLKTDSITIQTSVEDLSVHVNTNGQKWINRISMIHKG